MPITRADGRHWCAPEREPHPPVDFLEWRCPVCETVWTFMPDRSTWAQPSLFPDLSFSSLEHDGEPLPEAENG